VDTRASVQQGLCTATSRLKAAHISVVQPLTSVAFTSAPRSSRARTTATSAFDRPPQRSPARRVLCFRACALPQEVDRLAGSPSCAPAVGHRVRLAVVRHKKNGPLQAVHLAGAVECTTARAANRVPCMWYPLFAEASRVRQRIGVFSLYSVRRRDQAPAWLGAAAGILVGEPPDSYGHPPRWRPFCVDRAAVRIASGSRLSSGVYPPGDCC